MISQKIENIKKVMGNNDIHPSNDQDEFILAMELNTRTESSEWKERKATLEEATRRATVTSILHTSDDHHTKICASLVPDEIIYNVDDFSIRNYTAALLFADVSGFTDLSERYNRTGKGGPSRLTQVLNAYIGSMVQEIMSHNGDILKFSGDAFLCMWKCSLNESMEDVVHDIIDCAINIQKFCGTYVTDVGVTLRVKLAIAAGDVVFSLIGNESNMHYIVIGQPVMDVKNAEYMCTAGDIMVTPAAWQYINPIEYQIEVLEDGQHVKILGVTGNWRSVERTFVSKTNESTDETAGLFKPLFEESEEDNSDSDFENVDRDIPLLMNLCGENIVQACIREDEFTLRPSVNEAAKRKMKEKLRPFMILPVMRGIDLGEPLEYLTEMRHVVIVFVNVIYENVTYELMVNMVDTIFQKVVSIVNDMRGTVNKLSMFDKDLMFLIIFGLRGFKCELESQRGLRCASDIKDAISTIKYVTQVSVGVTTGMTYCGVVGHTLRREYTVISITVNKGARLMCAYPGKVTCDRDTFLHSKLEARNFILQEQRVLKGLQNVGPIYEFKEEKTTQTITTSINHYPLLGHDQEVEKYLELIQELEHKTSTSASSKMSTTVYSILVIKGEARQGKTRLLDEIVYLLPCNIPVVRFSLCIRDYQIPFQTIRLLFSLPLGLKALHDKKDVQDKLLARLSQLQVPQLLCSLNPIFKVNFPLSSMYLELKERQKFTVQKKIIRQLSYTCFPTLWLVAVDNAEFIDEESWAFVREIVNLNVIFFAITLGVRRNLTPEIESWLNGAHIYKMELHSIAKWYHVGLACQILDVHAIPPELERVIQSRSNGNPGWIESFLVSLIQAGGLVIKQLSQAEIDSMGLVSPPLTMMTRINDFKRKSDITSSIISRNFGDDSWQMYKHTFRESQINMIKQQKVRKTKGKVPVCIIVPDFNIEDVDSEVSMDAMIMKTFDSLTSYDQLLLKCSAVLGEIFPRTMLVYLMSSEDNRATALAIKRLFDIRVLGCAQGDFKEGDTYIVFRHRLTDPNLDLGIRCDCIGTRIPPGCEDLQNYAFCGYLRFRTSTFRDIIYNLLTDNQRKDFHNRAVHFLEKNTRRCKSCGNGFFVKILGVRTDDGLPDRNRQTQFRDLTTENIVIASKELKKNSTFQSREPSEDVDESADDTEFLDTKESDIQVGYCGFKKTRRKSLRPIALRSFATAEFNNCQCALILMTMYTMILEHCRGAGKLETMMDAMLEYADVCIHQSNVPQAMRILEDAANLLETTPIAEDDDPAWRIPILQGQIQTLVGHARLELGLIDEAFESLHGAMKNFGIPFPHSHTKAKIMSKVRGFKQTIMLQFFHGSCVSTQDDEEAEFCSKAANCLSLLFHLYKISHIWDMAELAALWGLNKSIESNLDFYGLCMAYSDAIEVACHFGKFETAKRLERFALMLCYRKTTSIEFQELMAVARLYTAIFMSRYERSELDYAVGIGFVTLRISSAVMVVSLSLTLLPKIARSLILLRRLPETVTMLHELDYLSEEDTDCSGRTWFFALCMEIHNLTGYTVLSFKRCEQFYYEECAVMVSVRDPDAERRYFTNMWLWCVRNEDWEEAIIWHSKAKECISVQEFDTPSHVISAMYYIEGLIIYLIGKMNMRNITEVKSTHSEIQLLMKNTKSGMKITKFAYPRYLFLKAYLRQVEYHDEKANILLNEAKYQSEKCGNLLLTLWIEHVAKCWNGTLPSVLNDLWVEHCSPEKELDWHEEEINDGRLIFYSPPLPKRPIY